MPEAPANNYSSRQTDWQQDTQSLTGNKIHKAWLATRYTRPDWQQDTQSLTGNKIHKAWLATMYTRTDWQQGTQGLTGNKVHKDWLATRYTRTDWQQGTQRLTGNKVHKDWLATRYTRTDWQQGTQGPTGNKVHKDWLATRTRYTRTDWQQGQGTHGPANYSSRRTDWQQYTQGPVTVCPDSLVRQKNVKIACWICRRVYPHARAALTAVMSRLGDPGSTPPLLSTPPVTPQTQYWQLPWIQSDWQNSVLAPSPPHLHCYPHHLSHYKHSTDSYHGYRWTELCPGSLPSPHCCSHHLSHHKHSTDSYHGYRWTELCPGSLPSPHCCSHHVSHHKHSTDSYHGYRVMNRALTWLHPHHTPTAIHTTCHTTNTVLTVTMDTEWLTGLCHVWRGRGGSWFCYPCYLPHCCSHNLSHGTHTIK